MPQQGTDNKVVKALLGHSMEHHVILTISLQICQVNLDKIDLQTRHSVQFPVETVFSANNWSPRRDIEEQRHICCWYLERVEDFDNTPNQNKKVT